MKEGKKGVSIYRRCRRGGKKEKEEKEGSCLLPSLS